MSDYKNFTAEDYLADESFVNYLLQQNEADIELWKSRKAAGLLQEQEYQRAINLFTALREEYKTIHINKEEELEKLRRMIAGQQDAAHTLSKIIPVSRRRHAFLRYAWPAAAAVLILVAAGWYLFQSAANKPTPVKDFIAFAVTQQDIRKVTLPDGSTVILNGNSSISITPGFNDKKREVLLNGTAFFQVAKDPNKPFTVISGRVNTTALGTSFYIHQSSNKAPTTVSLLTGKVRVQVEGQPPVQLVPYEKSIYHPEQELVKTTFDNDALVNWTKGMVIFRKANWEQVKNVIEEYFDKKLVIENYKKDISFTGEFKADQLESILSSLEFTYDLKYTIQNQTVNIAF